MAALRTDRLRALIEQRDPARGRQRRLARALGVSEPQISEWLSGNKVPGRDALLALAAYLGVTAEELMHPPASG